MCLNTSTTSQGLAGAVEFADKVHGALQKSVVSSHASAHQQEDASICQ